MKYIIFKDEGKEVPIIFPETMDHSRFVGLRPISAGFVNLYGDDRPLEGASCNDNAIKVWAGGESTSLGLKSRPEDKEILEKALMLHYN
jgi:hypothetical protein